MTSNPDFRALEPVAPLPLADAVATAESECLHFLTTETGRSLTPDLIESFYGQFRGIIAGLVDALAQADEPAVPAPPADGDALPEGYIDPEHSGDDRALLETYYAACQAEGGTADDITLRGLRAVLDRWGNPRPRWWVGTDESWDALVDRLWGNYQTIGHQGERIMYEADFCTALDLVRQEIARWATTAPTAPPADEEVAELVVWLLDTAIEAADASLPTAAGMLTWAAQVVGEHAELLQRGQAK